MGVFPRKWSENMTLHEIIASNIVELRKQNKLTQAELASKLHYTDKAVSKWERGESIPEIETLKQIADLFNVTVDFLLTENAIKDIQKYIVPKVVKRNRWIIAGVASLVVWIMAIAVFVYGYVYFEPNQYFWHAFVWAVPCNALVMIIACRRWGIKKFSVYLFSLLVWSLLIAIYTSTMIYETWIVFIVGLPLQALVILLCLLKKY